MSRYTKENLYAITAVIVYMFYLISIKYITKMISCFLLLLGVFLPRFVLTYLFLGFYQDLGRKTNNIIIPTCSSGENRNWFSSCLSGGESNPSTQCYILCIDTK